MGKVVYALNVSLDGYAATTDGGLDWANVDEELHFWFNDRTRDAAAFVYGRRMYELMAGYWPGGETDPEATPAMREFARLWVPVPKFVVSTRLEDVDWNGELVRDAPATLVRRLRTTFDGEIQVGGPTLAASLIHANLVDEYRLLVHPVVLGAGLRFFPQLERQLDLRPIDRHRFASGVEYLAYAPR